ncbi:gliding motility-associated C-terminal domain-containing protein [Ferruginibacter sp.]
MNRLLHHLRSHFTRIFLCFMMLVAATMAKAQLCSGSLGDPVVNITFGPGGTNTTTYAPTNAYTYTGSTCPNDGSYTITNATSGCFGGSWHTVNSDHTGNGGMFMLVNASYNPGDFFVTTVTDLCPNTTYEFASWIMNVLNRAGIKPNITFSIETPSGAILNQYSTGDIPETPSPTWKQYGFFFITPVNNPVIVLRMTNNAPGGSGNDLALDDITFRPCSPVTFTSAIQGNPDTVNICEGNTTQYTFNGTISTGYTSPVYQWQVSTDSGANWKDITGATALTYLRKPTGAGSYWYRNTVTEKTSLTIIACRIASNVVAVNVHGKPTVSAGPDRVMIAGTSVTILGQVSGENPTYYWHPPESLSDASLLEPVANPAADKTYILNASSAYGCSSEDTMIVKVVPGIFVPNSFTPNADGKNDHWQIPFLDPAFGAEVSVYNRYGQLVYHVKGGVVDWDGNYGGQPQSGGTYVYYIHFYGTSFPDMKGSLLLIR